MLAAALSSHLRSKRPGRPALLTSLLLTAFLLSGCSPPPNEPPNVILVGLDTLRADVMSTFGGEPGLTPNLDQLADSGVAFLDVTAPSPWTLPSFASLMTGLPPQSHGAGRRIGDSLRLREVTFTPLAPGATTLAERFTAAGYATAGFFNNPFLGPAFGLERGFDTHVQLSSPHRAATVVERGLNWIDRRDPDRPFFLFLHFFDPHIPYEPPQPYCREIADQGLEVERPCSITRSATRHLARPRRARAFDLYRAEVAYLDASIGRLLEALRHRGLDDDLVLLAVADHGESFWEREAAELERGYIAEADHGKSHFTELIRVPAVLRAPDLAPRRVDDPTTIEALHNVLLAAAGLGSEPISPGELRLKPERFRISDFILYGPPRAAMIRGRWKLVARQDGGAAELYDLVDDPDETNNVAALHPDVVETLSGWLAQELDRREAAGHRLGAEEDGAVMDDELREQLGALGYLD